MYRNTRTQNTQSGRDADAALGCLRLIPKHTEERASDGVWTQCRSVAWTGRGVLMVSQPQGRNVALEMKRLCPVRVHAPSLLYNLESSVRISPFQRPRPMHASYVLFVWPAPNTRNHKTANIFKRTETTLPDILRNPLNELTQKKAQYELPTYLLDIYKRSPKPKCRFTF